MWKLNNILLLNSQQIKGEIINNLRYSDNTTLMVESKKPLKSLLMKVKEESEKAGFRLSMQNTRIVMSSLITSWQTDGEKWKQ